MKGKIAFVFGAAVGYVLGSRAGRERYEQIKRGAQNVWNTEPVQRQVEAVKSATIGKLGDLGTSVLNAGKGAMASFMSGPDAEPTQAARPAPAAATKPSADANTDASAEASDTL